MKFRCQCRPWLYYSEAIHDLYFELVSPDRTGAPPRWPRGSQIRKQFGNPSNLRNQISPWQDPWLQGGPRVCHYFGNCRMSNIILTSFGQITPCLRNLPIVITQSCDREPWLDRGARQPQTWSLQRSHQPPCLWPLLKVAIQKISDSNVDVKSTFSQQNLFREVFEALKNICCCSGCSWAYTYLSNLYSVSYCHWSVK